MGSVVSIFPEGNKETVILRVCVADEQHKKYYDEPDYDMLSRTCRYVEDVVMYEFKDELFRKGYGNGEVKDFSVKDIYIEYGTLHIIFSYSLEGMIARGVLFDLVDEVAKNEI